MVLEPTEIHPFAADDAAVVSDLVLQVFDEYVAPSFRPEGIAEMHTFVAPDAIAQRAENAQTLVAWQGTSIVGMIQMRDIGHISLLFVQESFMGRGVATALMDRVEKACRLAGQSTLSVNSSLNAQSFYEHLGFEALEKPQTLHGFAFVLMQRRL